MSEQKGDYTAFHWAFQAAKKTIGEHGDQELYTVASGISPSGIIHIGNFREFITQELVKRAFQRLGKNVRHICSWDDFDVFRKVPVDMPNQEMLTENLRRRLSDVPDPYNEHETYAQHNIRAVSDLLPVVGVTPIDIFQSEKYGNCDYAEQIKFCLEHKEEIREILNEPRKEPLADDWLPITLFCEESKKDDFKKLEWKGDYEVYYEEPTGEGKTIDFRKTGIVKLNWRVDWPMRWHYEKVHFEPAGKDHSTEGGSRDTGKLIQEKLWNETPPTYMRYDFVRIKGRGGKISSSKGDAVTLKECLEVYEPEIVRYLFVGTRPGSEFDISFDTDVMKIYEDYDKCERIYYGKQEVKEKEVAKQKFIYEFSQIDENVDNVAKEMPLQIGFRHITTILQIKDSDIKATVDYFKDDIKNDKDKQRLTNRVTCVKNWLAMYADEQFKFEIKKEKDEAFFKTLDDNQKLALEKLKEAVSQHDDEESLSTALFAASKELNFQMKDYFTLCYQAIIGKEKGPKLATFILEIGKERVLSLL